jgi:hypothetical protein
MTPLLVQERLVQEQVLVQQQVQVPVLAQVVEPELQQAPRLVLGLSPHRPRLQSQFLLQLCHLLAHESLSTHLQ